MINPDNPIKQHEEDLLYRWGFAEHIAKNLLDQSSEDCIVIGIYGNWGSGKSSLINLVERNIEEITQNSFKECMGKAVNEWYENIGYYTLIVPYLNMPLELERPTFKSLLNLDIQYKKNSLINLTKYNLQKIPYNQKAPIVFWFSPWNISTMDKLISMYFQELSIAIEKEDKSENAKALAKRLELYSILLRPFAYYPDTVVSFTSKKVKNILKDASNSIKDEYKQAKHNLGDLKKEIEEHLECLNRRVIIIIDDIDRLTQKEICQIFQLVKINANFKNVTYLLIFDKDIVEKALGEVSNGQGREYLEKIIQMPYKVPEIDNENLYVIFDKELEKVLTPYPDLNFDKIGFGKVYCSGYSNFFRSVRDIRRYMNSINFNIDLIHKEVNIIDFLIIEAFRLYMPEVYSLISESKQFFTNKHSNFLETEVKFWEQKSNFVFEKIGKENESTAKSLLAYLFPEKYNLLGETYPTGSSDEDECQKNKRICSIIFFDTYFITGVPKSILSESDFINVVQQLRKIEERIELSECENINTDENGELFCLENALKQDKDSIGYVINDLINKNYANQFLRKLYIQNIEFSNTFLKYFLSSLAEIRDYSPKNEEIDLYLLYKVIAEYFKPMTYSDKIKLFKYIMIYSRGISTTMSMLIISQEDEKSSYGFPPLFKEKDIVCFRKLWSDKLESLATSGELKKHKEAPRLLDIYNSWGNQKKAKIYFDELVTTHEGFLNYLTKISYKRSSGIQINGVSNEVIDFAYSLLEPFLSVHELKQRLNSLDNLSNNDSKFVEIAKKRLDKYKPNKNY